MYEIKRPVVDEQDEELTDTLIAISVVAKRLAEKLRRQKISPCERCRRTETIRRRTA